MVLLALETWPFFCCWQNFEFYMLGSLVSLLYPRVILELVSLFSLCLVNGIFFKVKGEAATV